MTADVLLADGSGLARGDQPVTDWPSIRRWVLERDGRLCQVCRISEASDVDHIWPRRLGGRDHISNLRAACGPCNKAKSGKATLETATPAELIQGIQALAERAAELTREASVLAAHALLHDLDSGDLSWLAAVLISGQHSITFASLAVRREISQRELIARVPDADVIAFPTKPADGAA